MTAFVNLRYYHQSAGTEILILEEYNPENLVNPVLLEHCNECSDEGSAGMFLCAFAAPMFR